MKILENYVKVGDKKLFTKVDSVVDDCLNQGKDLRDSIDSVLNVLGNKGSYVSKYNSIEPKRVAQETKYLTTLKYTFDSIFENARQTSDPEERKRAFRKGMHFARNYMEGISGDYEQKKEQADSLLDKRDKMAAALDDYGAEMAALQDELKKSPDDAVLKESLKKICNHYAKAYTSILDAENKWSMLNLAMETDYKSCIFFQEQKERFQEIVDLYEKN